jgi:hypothetical protein
MYGSLAVSTYYMNWAAFELPDPAADRTTHVVELPHPRHPGITLVIYHEDFPAGKTLTDLVAARVADETIRLAGYGVLERTETEWAGQPALEVASRWRHEGRAIYQRQAHLAVGSTWTSFALIGPVEAREICDAWLDGVRQSLRLRSDP